MGYMRQRVEGLNLLGDISVVVDVSDYTSATVQVVQNDRSSGSSTAIFTLYRSNDGANFYALATPTTVSPGSITSTIDVTGFSYLKILMTTADSGVALSNGSVFVFAQNSISQSPRTFDTFEKAGLVSSPSGGGGGGSPSTGGPGGGSAMS